MDNNLYRPLVFQIRVEVGQGPGANRQGTQRGPTNNADLCSWHAGPAVIEHVSIKVPEKLLDFSD
jgi:hypothetical protein